MMNNFWWKPKQKNAWNSTYETLNYFTTSVQPRKKGQTLVSIIDKMIKNKRDL